MTLAKIKAKVKERAREKAKAECERIEDGVRSQHLTEIVSSPSPCSLLRPDPIMRSACLWLHRSLPENTRLIPEPLPGIDETPLICYHPRGS